jgi:transcriptional regulator with XRE-family HTH domain
VLISEILGPIVTVSQGLKVTDIASNFRSMEPTPEKVAFARRLNLVCDEKKLPPEEGRGRQPALAKIFGVNAKAARKWLKGEGFPELEMVIRICNWADVNIDWLLRGKGPKRGVAVETRLLALGEMLERLPDAERRDVLGMLMYKLHQSAPTQMLNAHDAAHESLLAAWSKSIHPTKHN